MPHILYNMYLSLLGSHLDDVLTRTLEPIGEAIAATIKRYEEIRSQLAPHEEMLMAEDEGAVIDNMLGTAFLVCQVFINTVVEGVKRIHRCADEHDGVQLVCVTQKRDDIMRHGSSSTEAHSPIEVINAFANYFKHCEEWPDDWSRLSEHQRRTAEVIKAAGARESSGGNLRVGAEYLGNPNCANVSLFARHLTTWRKALVEVHTHELLAKGLLAER